MTKTKHFNIRIELMHLMVFFIAEEIFANKPFYRKTKKGHYAAFGFTLGGRYLKIIFELKPEGVARPNTGWDMSRVEFHNYKKHWK